MAARLASVLAAHGRGRGEALCARLGREQELYAGAPGAPMPVILAAAMAGVIFPPRVALVGPGAPQLRPWVVYGAVLPAAPPA